jgi:hypothetical protein
MIKLCLRKLLSKKVYIAIFLLVLLVGIAVAAIVYTTQTSSSPVVLGVNVGDAFTYKLTGTSVLGSADAVTPGYLSEYNGTDYYKVTITGINGSVVSFDTVWQFTNGTAVQNSEWVDLSTGSDNGDFWAIYASNLNVNNLLRPKGFDTLIVNSTDTQTYTSSTRQRNFWSIENVFTDITDPTGNTQRYDFMCVYFDKQTEMLDTLTNIQYYNNPQYNLIITWQLTNSTVWGV